MTTNIEQFLAFCDKHDLNFEIKYRPNFRDPQARFFLSFSPLNKIYVEDETSDGNGWEQYEGYREYHFSDGNTPLETLENVIAEFKGRILRIQKYDGEPIHTILR